MTELVPSRAINAERETRPDGTVVERIRVVEYAAHAPPAPSGPPALPPGPPGRPTRVNTRPDGTGMWLYRTAPAPARTPALPPAPPARRRRWWRRWLP